MMRTPLQPSRRDFMTSCLVRVRPVAGVDLPVAEDMEVL